MIDQKKIDSIDALVVGWMEPVMYRSDPVTGEVLNGLGPADFNRVKSGYGCPKCCAKFKTYLLTCPVCSYTRNLEEDVVSPPQHWVDHLEERNAAWSDSTPVSADDFFAEVMSSPDIDHRKL
jgi:hypothetical protein